MTIVKLFETQAAKTPDSIAVIYGHKELTYAQLNLKANQLAHHLQKMGVGKEKLVGLFLERSLEMIISILGVLKAGGAYVPLDPDYPMARVAFMLEDTKIPVLLTQSHLTQLLFRTNNSSIVSNGLKVISLDTSWDELEKENNKNPDGGPTDGDLAYVIYTSGSTGQPKGVMNEHRGIYNRLVWMLNEFPLTDKDRVLQKTPFSFDVSIWEIFWPILSGACLVVTKPGGHKDSDYLIDYIVEQDITNLHFVPSMLQVFLLNPRISRCKSIKRVFCSGEALPYDLQERFFSLFDAELFNLYGPTEAAIEVTWWACKRDSDLSTVPIGKPLPNVHIHILDPQLQPVPAGEQGELHIGGVQVARGYLNRPNLTHEKFIPDPFSPDSTARLYKTGDLARYSADGNINYLGRIDHQVKIRGNRVELGEIEATLILHSHVREAVVNAYEVASGDTRLAAYIVPDHNNLYLINQLRDFLATKLPEYMIPASFMISDSLPLTPSGKVNRHALPLPDLGRPDLSESYIAPRNFTEEILAEIWENVIGLERVGIHDNFLELGGDSIQSIQITSRANQAGLRVTPNQILEHPTIAELAKVAGSGTLYEAEQGVVTGSLPLSPIQKWYLDKDRFELDHNSQVFLIKVTNTLATPIHEKLIKKLLLHHDALRLRINKDETGWHALIAAPDENFSFSSLDLSGLSAEEQEYSLQPIIEEFQSSLNLSEGPMFKVALLDHGTQAASYLLIVVHQLAIDGISWRILLEHLALLYQQLNQNQSMQLPPKTTSYKQWAQRLTEYASSDRLNQELSFWLRTQHQGATHLPTDHSEAVDIIESSNDIVSVSLSQDITLSLLKDVPKVYKTLITDVLLTALMQGFSLWTGGTTMLIDIEGHGRETLFEDIDLSYTVGCFSAIYPILLDIGCEKDPGEMLITIKEQLRQVPNGGVGYGILRYLSQDDSVIQILKGQPKSKVSFHHLGQLDSFVGPSSVFKLTDDFRYPQRNLRGNRGYLIEITSYINQDQLCLEFSYCNHSYRRKTIEKLAGDILNALENLISHCKSRKTGRYTPSDFPEASLSQQELDELLLEINDFLD